MNTLTSAPTLTIIASALAAFAFMQITSSVQEGMAVEPSKDVAEYTDYDPNVAILAQKNAGNIAYLKERIKSQEAVDGRLTQLEQRIELLQSQLNSMAEQQASYAKDLVGEDLM